MIRRFLAVSLLTLTPSAFAQDVETYKVPPPELAALADAPLTPSALIAPGDESMLLLDIPPLLTIEDLSQQELKLAGIRFNPRKNDQTRSAYFTGMTLVDLRSGRQRPVAGLPASPRIRNVSWSPNGAHFAFTSGTADGVELWLGDTALGTVRRLTPAVINAAYPARPFRWLSDSRTLVARVLPEKREQPPADGGIPAGPLVQENRGRKTPARTYPDMIRTPHEAALFEYHLQSQLALVDLAGVIRRIGNAGLVVDADPSPNAEFLLVEIMQRPFSYVLPENRFPRRYEIWNLQGARVKEVANVPLADTIPTDFSATRTGRRGISWRADRPAALFWVEAQDEGNPRVEAAIRDRIFTLEAPFDGEPRELAALATRFSGIYWGDGDTALISESWWKSRNNKVWRIAPDDPSRKPQLLFDRSFEDRYLDPGSPVMKSNAWGRGVLRIVGGRAILMQGEGASPEGDRPFLDRLDLVSGKKTRLWRSEAPHYEFVYDVLDDSGTRLVTRRESVNEPPNYFLRDLRSKKSRALTSFPHPLPALSKVTKELIHYQRADGVKLTGTLYLPPGYDPAKNGPLPVLMWAYPQEFKSADAAGQVTSSPHRFIRLSPLSPLPWLMRGYAILDNPTMPIVGEGKAEPNDTYVDQLIAGAKAAIDELVRRGVGDRKRMAIGGHSYGAFTTANLLAHSDLFRAGIARSGAYNRTLTPFGFQSEERTFWEAADTYMKMSPFTHAQKINEPLLMIHGVDDNNSGTFPIQSERFFQAIKGLGGTVRLVMLPSESHGYRARESVLHQMWEIDQWLEKYVK